MDLKCRIENAKLLVYEKTMDQDEFVFHRLYFRISWRSL
jgi:hypothetical protein